VLGFAYLSQLDSAAARSAFERAVELEPAAPLPRLGRGLALIQGGDMIGGRQQIELAVALDPTNALARSYMAKVYEAENRVKLTGSQLDLAKRFDQIDPTPWLYSALQKLRANRPVEAFHDLQTASSKNGDRVALRSWLPMDADLATRSSSVARVDAELGFDRLALADAWQAVGRRPSDYTGHRLLADAYSREPRAEIARVSELFVAQLLQPANLTPIPAQLGQPSTFLAAHLGPGLAPFNELGSPVTQNGLRLQASGAAGGNGTSGTEVAVAGLHDQVSYGFGQYRFESDGFRTNNDRDERVANAFVQIRPALDTNLQIELRSTRNTHGDLALAFDPSAYSPLARLHDSSDSLRFGARHNLAAHDSLLASVIHERAAGHVTVGDTYAFSSQGSTSGIDLQLIHDAGVIRLQTGVAHANRKESGETRFALPGDPPMASPTNDDLTQTDVYGYVLVDPVSSVTITAGAAWDRIRTGLLTEHAANPKLGVTWRPTSRTTVRAAALRSLSGSLTTSRLNPQPRLEPAQVAGFSQLLFGGVADRSTVRSLAVDHTLSQRLFAGWEASHRDTDTSILNPVAPPELQVEGVTLRERTQRAYLYWTPHDRLGFSAKLEHGRYAGTLPLNGIPLFHYSDLTIERLPIELRYFSPNGLMLGFRTSHIADHGTFVMGTPIPGTLAPGGDRFWLVDAFVGYRLPNRRGLLSLNADNLLDRRFRFQDVDPEDTSLIPERLISFRFTLSFD
jgi:tetratricopeptide (TPR) repeat protein